MMQSGLILSLPKGCPDEPYPGLKNNVYGDLFEQGAHASPSSKTIGGDFFSVSPKTGAITSDEEPEPPQEYLVPFLSSVPLP